MDLRRARRWEWASAIAAVALLVAMFLDWYSADDRAVNAWQALAVVDVFLAIAALMGVALFVAAVSQRSPAVAQALAALTTLAAFVAAVLVVMRTLDLPDFEARELGLWIGLGATLGLLASTWKSMGDERFPRAAAPDVEVTPLPAPKARTDPQGD